MSNSSITINGMAFDFTPGQTVLEAAKDAGFSIPTLCHIPKTESNGSCGVCLVELLGTSSLVRACKTEVKAGMQIKTDSPRILQARRKVLRGLASSGYHNCLVMDCSQDAWTGRQVEAMQLPWHDKICPAYGDCRLQDLMIQYQVSLNGIQFPEVEPSLDDNAPMIVRDYSRCIGCGRCAAACNQIQGNHAIAEPEDWSLAQEQGWRPSVDYDKCTHCGECLQVCPVGALFEKKAFGAALANDTTKMRTTCPYCGVGCQLSLHIKDGRVIKVTGVEGAQPNRGRLCVKGRFGYDFIHSSERLTTPLIRQDDGFREASWDEALDLVADKFRQIIAESGPDAIAGVSCARSTNEDSYNMQKLFRAGIGTNNIDHCART